MTVIIGLCLRFPVIAHSASGISINEVCPVNTFYKAPDGKLYGWIEFYNSSSGAVDVSGWGISDDPSEPMKYTFPDGAVIQAGGRLVVFCSPENVSVDITKESNTLILTDNDGNEVSNIKFGKLTDDISYGQFPDGSEKYSTMECTPHKPNISQSDHLIVQTPEFSHKSGFYDKEFMLSINVPDGATVYYTTDGSEPTTDSKKYNADIRVYDRSDTPNIWSAKTDISSYGAVAPKKNVDKSFIIRAFLVDSDGRKSSTVSANYFLGKTNDSYYKEMKVVSITTDPDNLFNYNTGIYVKGKIFDTQNIAGTEAWNMNANYTQKGRDWEREAFMEVFDKGKKVLSQNVGIRIKGATSRSTPQKSFNVYAREEYGNKKLDYDFFDGSVINAVTGKAVDSYETLTIRNAGNDTPYSYLRDNINHSLVSDRSLTMQSMNECILFIDGEFWGFYTFTEKTDDSFIKKHYNIKKKNVAIIKNNEIEEGTDEDLKDWNAFISKSARTDMTVEENYKEFCSKCDTDSLIEYFAMQIYWCNGDWPWNNVAVWRSKNIDNSNPYSDGKWRMLLFDTDFTTGLYKNTDTVYTADTFAKINGYDDNISRTFMRLLKNHDFRKEFCNVFMDLANYNFSPERTDSIIEDYREKYRQQIYDTNERFYASTFVQSNSVSRFDSEVDVIKDFYRNRFKYATDSLKRITGSGLLKKVTLRKNAHGSIQVNTITPDISEKDWCGQYFSDYGITLKAVADEGYKFEKWEITGTRVLKAETKLSKIVISPDDDVIVRAVFKKL